MAAGRYRPGEDRDGRDAGTGTAGRKAGDGAGSERRRRERGVDVRKPVFDVHAEKGENTSLARATRRSQLTGLDENHRGPLLRLI